MSATKRAERSALSPITPTRVLIVAHQTAGSQRLIETVAARAAEGPCTFTLLVPAAPRGLRRVATDYSTAAAERRLSAALPLLSTAAGEEVVGVVGALDPLVAVRDALKVMEFDEVIVSMLPPGLSRWHQLGLPGKIRALGVPVIEVMGSPDFTPLPAA
jgi:hypothetical protein